MKLLCKIFGHKWQTESKIEGFKTLLEANYICKRCKWMMTKKQYIGSVLISIYDDEWQRMKEWTQSKW